MKIFSAVILLSLAVHSTLTAKTTLVEKGSEGWRYHDTGGDPGDDWNTAEFDDSAWKSGAAPLGYGDDGIATTLGFGGDKAKKHPAAFFRKTITVPDGIAFAKLKASLRCDDGAAIYLNGMPVGRYNLGSDPVTHETRARDAIAGQTEREYIAVELSPEHLKVGENVLALSVHQATAESSDLVVDLALVGLAQDDLPKRGRLREEAREAVDAYHKGHFVKPGLKIPNGYVDGGTYMKIKEDGLVVATREVITVDRERDAKLQEHLAFARTTSELPPVDRASKLARYIDELTTPARGRSFAEPATRKLQDFRNAEMLLGNIPEYCGAGVCRHRSLFFKILGDEAGLQVALRRGLLYHRGRIVGRHAWNELTLADGSMRIVDVMNPEENFALPEAAEVTHNYGDIKGKPLYKKKAKSNPKAEKDEGEDREKKVKKAAFRSEASGFVARQAA